MQPSAAVPLRHIPIPTATLPKPSSVAPFTSAGTFAPAAAPNTRASTSGASSAPPPGAVPPAALAHVQALAEPLKATMAAGFEAAVLAIRSALAAELTADWTRTLEVLHREVARAEAHKAAAAQMREEMAALRAERARARRAEERATRLLREAAEHNRVLAEGIRQSVAECARLKAAAAAEAKAEAEGHGQGSDEGGQAGGAVGEGEEDGGGGGEARFPAELMDAFKKTVVAEMEMKVAHGEHVQSLRGFCPAWLTWEMQS
jgi:hypothetical protein